MLQFSDTDESRLLSKDVCDDRYVSLTLPAGSSLKELADVSAALCMSNNVSATYALPYNPRTGLSQTINQPLASLCRGIWGCHCMRTCIYFCECNGASSIFLQIAVITQQAIQRSFVTLWNQRSVISTPLGTAEDSLTKLLTISTVSSVRKIVAWRIPLSKAVALVVSPRRVSLQLISGPPLYWNRTTSLIGVLSTG